MIVEHQGPAGFRCRSRWGKASHFNFGPKGFSPSDAKVLGGSYGKGGAVSWGSLSASPGHGEWQVLDKWLIDQVPIVVVHIILIEAIPHTGVDGIILRGVCFVHHHDADDGRLTRCLFDLRAPERGLNASGPKEMEADVQIR